MRSSIAYVSTGRDFNRGLLSPYRTSHSKVVAPYASSVPTPPITVGLCATSLLSPSSSLLIAPYAMSVPGMA
eukprot:44246-Rhodomonas_salina.1